MIFCFTWKISLIGKCHGISFNTFFSLLIITTVLVYIVSICVNLSLTSLFISLGLCDSQYASKKLLLAHNIQISSNQAGMALFTHDTNQKQTRYLIILWSFYPIFPPHFLFPQVPHLLYHLKSPGNYFSLYFTGVFSNKSLVHLILY